jgi:hypothetical protein
MCASVGLVIAGLFVLPALLAAAGAVLALAAVPMSTARRELQLAVVAVATVGFVVDMTVAVLVHHRLF